MKMEKCNREVNSNKLHLHLECLSKVLPFPENIRVILLSVENTGIVVHCQFSAIKNVYHCDYFSTSLVIISFFAEIICYAMMGHGPC